MFLDVLESITMVNSDISSERGFTYQQRDTTVPHQIADSQPIETQHDITNISEDAKIIARVITNARIMLFAEEARVYGVLHSVEATDADTLGWDLAGIPAQGRNGMLVTEKET